MPRIHPTAIVSSEAELAADVDVGAYALIGSNVTIGAGTSVGPYTRIEGTAVIGERNHFYGHGSIGGPPQDLKFKGEESRLEIGEDNTFREFVSINRGTTGGGGVTIIGSHNYFMVYSHVAHDCRVGSHTVFANSATLAGHVEVGDFATIGAFSAVHQFCRVGEHAFIGGGTMCTQDVLPYAKTVSPRDNTSFGINTIGLERKGVPKESIEALQRAYRILVRSKLKLDDALQKIESELGSVPEARYLVEFVRASKKRGFIR
ncbi:MAG: acyl-ACP--UDP-N-acetylglucosamine O-acyltransferase [Acidobacteriota bacterium]